MQIVTDANYHLDEELVKDGVILFTDSKELFSIRLYAHYGFETFLKDIKNHGVKGIDLIDIYQGIHIPAGIGGVMVGDSPSQMIKIYGDQYYKTSEEYWDIYHYELGKDRDSELRINFWVYKKTNEIAKISMDTYR